MIKILLFTISFLVIFFFESFFLKVLSFSVFAILVISLWKRIGDIWFYIFLTFVGIGLDTVSHIPLGTHIVVTSVLLMISELLWVLIPKSGRYGNIPIFVFLSLYYLGILGLSSLLQDGVFLSLSIDVLIGILLKALISTLICILINHFFKLIREDKESGKIRLR